MLHAQDLHPSRYPACFASIAPLSAASRHLFCGRCGVKSFYQPRSHPEAWSVNLRCVEGGTWEVGEVREFDGQNWEQAREELG